MLITNIVQVISNHASQLLNIEHFSAVVNDFVNVKHGVEAYENKDVKSLLSQGLKLKYIKIVTNYCIILY